MTPEIKQQIAEILAGDPWKIRGALSELLKTVSLVEEHKGTRTSSQNNALHLWFKQISDICKEQGVTMNMVISHTHDVEVTPTGVKGLWHVLQKALFGEESTTKLKKVGQIEKMLDHFTVLFAKEEVELPPFPHDEERTKENISIPKRDDSIEYPEYEGEVKF